MSLHIPRYPPKTKRYSEYPPRFSTALIQALRRKAYYHKKFKRTNDTTDYLSFCNLRTSAAELLAADKKRLAAETRDAALKDPKKFWSLVNTKLKGKSLSMVLKQDDSLISDPTTIAHIFADQFANVARDNSRIDITQPLPDALNTHLHSVVITDVEIRAAITAIGTGFTTGEDSIPGFIIKGCGDILLPLLVHVFNLSLSTGVFPVAWKTALVTPVFKKGFAGDPKNYRPISLLCILAKIFDAIMYRRLYDWFKPYLADAQHGFISGRSVDTNLTCFMNQVAPEIETRGQVDVIYLDLAKAFDRVSHHRLLRKLSHYGLSGSLLEWIKDYFLVRNNTLKINGNITNAKYSVQCGVPQGSSLGPLLFNIYVTDLPLAIHHSSLYQFADDSKACKAIRSRADCLNLQEDLDRIQIWCDANNIPINPAKSVVVSYSRKSGVIRHLYQIAGALVARESLTKDLEVYFDSGLRFREHIAHSVACCKRALGASLKISRSLRSKRSFIQLYHSLVRSRALFACVVWGGCSAYLLLMIEAVQRKFIEYLHTHFDRYAYYDYDALIKTYGLDKISTQMMKIDLFFLHKLLRGRIYCPDLLSAVSLYVPQRAVRSKLTFVPRRSGLNPLHRLQSRCNSLAGTLDVFSCTVGDIKRLAP